MTRDEIAARARTVIAEVMDRTPESIADESTWDALDADSLDRIDCTMALEEEFDVEIPDHDADEMATFGAVVDFLAKKPGVGTTVAA